MKKHTFLRIMLVSALLVCATWLGGISALADDADTTLKIHSGNLAYNEMTHITFTLSGTPADGLEAGIAVWDKDVTAPAADNVSYYVFDSASKNGVTYYKTKGIPASEMSAQITVAPATRTAGDATNASATVAGGMVKYGIYDYVKSRLDDDGVTETQLKLYTNVVTYGNYAEKVLNKTVTSRILIAKNGYADGSKYGLALLDGETALIRANAVNSDGEYFLYWTDEEGNKVYDRVTNVTLGENSTTYTAKYGSASESAYAGHFDLSGLEVGQLNIVPSTIGTVTKDTNSGIYYATNDASFLNNTLTLFYGRIQVNSDTDKTVVKTTNLSVAENNGSKYLHFEKNGIGGNQLVSFTKKSGIVANRFEIDMAYTYRGGNENTALHFFFGSKECRIDIRYEANGDLYFFKSGTSTKVYGGNFAIGKNFTVAAEVNADGLVVVYVNGRAITSAKDGSHLLDGFDFGLTAGNSYTASKLWHESYSYDTNITEIYEVNFVDTDKFN